MLDTCLMHFSVLFVSCSHFFFFKQKTAYEMRISDWSSDVCSSDLIVRQWVDTEAVNVVVDVPTSSVALAVNEVLRNKNALFLASGPASSDITGKACSPHTVHWTYDTWALAHGTGSAMVETGGDTWFFLTADYAFGLALEREPAA